MDLSAICKQEEVADTLYAITFTLLSGKEYLHEFLFFTLVLIMYPKTEILNFPIPQAIFDDSDEYVSIFNRKFARKDSRVRVVHHVLHLLRTLSLKVHRVVQIRASGSPAINARLVPNEYAYCDY